MLPLESMQIREYLDVRGRSAFRRWADSLDSVARVKTVTAIARLENGNFSNVKNVGKGVLERKINFGPGLRIYFAPDGQHLVLLLGGGTKHRQDSDIKAAQRAFRQYKQRKARGESGLWH